MGFAHSVVKMLRMKNLEMTNPEKNFIYLDYVNPVKMMYLVGDKMGLDMFLLDQNGLEIGYWRKANQIHNWFVENIQGGIDDCGDYPVTISQLDELKTLCQEVLDDKSKAEELLPTRAGFFFGSIEYDDYYFDELIDTIRIIDNIKNDDEITEISYVASW